MSSLVLDLESSGLLAVAAAAGLHVKGRAFGPCPTCRADKRGSRDPRFPCGIFAAEGRLAWTCYRCHAGSDAAALASLCATGEPLSRGNVGTVRTWAQERGLVGRDQDGPRRAVRSEPGIPENRILEKIQAPRRPPVNDLEALRRSCVPVTKDREVSRWLESRGLDPAVIAERHLAGALPRGARLPLWARVGSRTWLETEHRAIIPLFDECGELASVRARAIVKDPWPAKAVAPVGFSVVGLLLADELARGMLASKPEAIELVRRAGLVVTEGEPDFLSWTTRASDALEEAPAVLGVIAGSWRPEIGARVPEGTRVVVRTHGDEAGEHYAKKVVDTLGGRCEVLRAAPEPEGAAA